MARDVDEVTELLGRIVWREVATSAITSDLTAAQVYALCQQVALGSLTTLRNMLVAAASGQVGSTEVGGESVVAPLVPDEPTEEPPDAG